MKKCNGFLGTVLSFLLLGAAAFGEGSDRPVDVWDFGASVDGFEGVNDNISAATFDNFPDDVLGKDGKFKKGSIDFGDLTLIVDNNDRIYYGSEDGAGKKNYGSQGYAVTDFDDGYTSNGLYYANGKGNETKRCMILRNVKAGDVITFYARISNSGDEVINFAHIDGEGKITGKQAEKAPLTSEARMYSYIAENDGAYKVYPGSAVGKPVYFRIKREPAASVSGKIANSNLLNKNAVLKFIVKETNQELSATIQGDRYTANLPAGHEFTALLQGVQGYSISSDTRVFSVSGNLAGKSASVNKAVAESQTYTAKGTITGFDQSYDFSNFAVVFVPSTLGIYQPVKATLGWAFTNPSFIAKLEPGVEYTAHLEGANDYEIKSGARFSFTKNTEQDLAVAKKPTWSVNGKFFGKTDELPSKITFKRLDDAYSYSGKISGGEYSASLRDGSYEVYVESATVKTVNHIVVSSADVKKDIKLSSIEKKAETLPFRSVITVGKSGDFKTVGEAVEAASAMHPRNESERITIEIEPGIYREQIKIDVPFITLKNADTSKEVKLTWYYGIGYKYYSADASGWFDADLAYDKFSKKTVAKWGGATYVMPSAESFKAIGITFETSFNKYVTDEEIEDGVESDGSIKFNRNYNADVRSKAGTERSAAILIEGDESEFINCRFLGSQDTFYTGANIKGYLRNCFIEGNTDYIFGSGTFVFENCELRFAGYTDKPSAGYITAARQTEDKGYLFLNCLVSRDENVYNAPGFFGRPWGADASVAFVNTTLSTDEAINDEGWTKMSSNKPEDARFKEVNTIWKDGLDLESRTEGTVKEDDGTYTVENYLGSWKPSFSVKKGEMQAEKAYFKTEPHIKTDATYEIPYVGAVLEVVYELDTKEEDASIIGWFRERFGKKTLVKSGTAADKDAKIYEITEDDLKCRISAIVLPQTKPSTVVSFQKKPSFTTDDDINTPYPGHTITLHYSLGSADSVDNSSIRWFRVNGGSGTETLVKQSTGFGDKTYLLQPEDTGSTIKAYVSARTETGLEGGTEIAKLDAVVNEGYAIPSNAAADVPRVFGAVNVFLASDSTCKDYSAKGMWSSNQTRNEGAWGEFLQCFFNSTVAIQNYANGGRSSRNFINEGSLDKIEGNIQKGDYLFIQFGHNDSSNSSGYLEDRYVPLGEPDAAGIYPTTAGKKVATPDSYKAKYGDEFYSYDNGGTYKWYLKQYIDVARKAGATPVLVTPVSRMYFSDGKIRPHHDSTDTTTGTLTTSGNAYVEAVRQLAKEENVILIDGFEITKSLYEKAYADKGDDSAARELMFKGDSTHNNKLGGFIIAGEFAKAIQKQIPELSKSVKKPAKAIGENSDGSIMFTVDSEGNFSCGSEYWTNYERASLSGADSAPYIDAK